MHSRPGEIRWYQRFYVRLAALFLVLLLGLGIVLARLAIGSTQEMTVAADQELNRDLATQLAPRFEPHLMDGVDEEAIDEIIAGLTQINRRLDVYLLESDGQIKGWFMGGGEDPVLDRVSMEPVMAFMEGQPAPVLGDDPARENTQRPFSISPISIMGEGCYLYLILQSEDYDHVFEMLEDGLIRKIVIRAALLAFLVTALVGLFLFWRVSRRLTGLQATVGSFESGRLDSRYEVDSRDEIGRLGLAFNSMADQIESQVEELKNTDKLRRELVANVSHDLRSPLASIQGYLETLQLKLGDLKPERQEHYVNIALAQTKRLSRLVSQLFELSKLDAQQIEPHKEAFQIVELVHDVVMQYQGNAEKNGVSLKAELPEETLPLVWADVGLVERVLTNLLENALRYTPEGGSINLRSAVAESRVAVSISDTGVGIPEEHLETIFDRFARVDQSRSRAEGDGGGLGLAIAKKIMDLHGGTIKAESTQGQGTTFTVGLPVAG